MKTIDKMVFLLYVLPFIFILIFADFKGYFTVALIVVGILTLALSTHFMWYGQPLIILPGNILSFIVSLVFVLIFLPTSVTGYYFKPLGPVGTLVLFTLLSVAIQYLVSWIICKVLNRFRCL